MKKHFLLILILLVFTAYNNIRSQWVQTKGAYRDIVQCFAVYNTNLFVGTSGNGVFLSSNNGINWTFVGLGYSYGTASGIVNALTISGTKLFAGTNEGVFLSTNNGTNWTSVNSGLPSGGV
ncbi:MAG: hypothetical protein GW789_01530, partial [Ignavibacteria bacterium]|nr:hypothetical protein [Ignavibacteria bacterium]